MKKTAILLVALAVVAGCSTADNPPPPDVRDRGGYSGYRPEGRDGMMAGRQGGGAGLEVLPPNNWWHDDQVAPAVALTGEQLSKLGVIGHDQWPEIERLRNDSTLVVRDLRTALEVEHPASADVVAAGQRIRALRDNLFDRELTMLDAERQLLTQQQWASLQDALTARRSQRQNDRPGGYGGRGGRRGGRGGFPGG